MIIESKFNVLDNRRPDGGNARRYQLENVRETIESSQWNVNNRQLLGYYGHPSTLLLQEGLQNQPSNVCMSLRLNGSIVEHSQQILETDTGKVVAALHKAGAGGWSWRAGGEDGGREAPTTINQLAGFDYVHIPSFTALTESVGENHADGKKKVRHHLIAEGLSNDFADRFLDSVGDNVSKEITRLQEDKAKALRDVKMLKESLVATSKATKNQLEERRAIVEKGLNRTPFRLKDSVLEVLATGVQSPEDLRLVMDALTKYQGVDLEALPLTEKVPTTVKQRWDEDDVNFDFNTLFHRN